MSSWNAVCFFLFNFPASTDWTCHRTKATSNWRRSWCLPSRRRKASDRSESNLVEEVGAGVWRNKRPPVFKSGSLFWKKKTTKKQRGQVFRVIVLLHACTHLAWYLCWCVCESLHVAAETLGCAKILYSFKPKQGSCSCLLECAAKYAWDPENSPSDICSSVFFPARDHVIAGNEVASGLQSSLNQKGHRF